jgi:hypothetical protein
VQGRDEASGDLHLHAGRDLAQVVDEAQPLVKAPGDGHLSVQVPDGQRDSSRTDLARVQLLDAAAQWRAGLVERVLV